MVNKSATQPPPKKLAFKISAHEDSFELEEDINSNGPSSQLAEGRGNLKISSADQKPLCAAEPTSKSAALLEVKTPSGVLGKKSDTETPDSGATAVKNTIFQPIAGSQSPATASNKETNVDKVPPFVFSSSTQVTGSKPGSSSRDKALKQWFKDGVDQGEVTRHLIICLFWDMYAYNYDAK